MAAPMEKISVNFEEDLAVICWNWGENRFNPTTVAALHDALDRVESDPDVKALIMTGAGKFFSNGLDLPADISNTGDVATIYKATADVFCRILTFPMPTVAAINGHAFAGGAFFALAHDYAVMQSERGWMSLNEVHMGFTFGEFFKMFYSAKVSDPSVRRDFVVYGKRFTAQEAAEARLITKACPREDLMDEAKKVARRAASGNYDRDSVQKLKEELYQSVLNLRPDVRRENVAPSKL